jgi:hypothetical protein
LADEISASYDSFAAMKLLVGLKLQDKRSQQALADQACQQVLDRAVKFL